MDVQQGPAPPTGAAGHRRGPLAGRVLEASAVRGGAGAGRGPMLFMRPPVGRPTKGVAGRSRFYRGRDSPSRDGADTLAPAVHRRRSPPNNEQAPARITARVAVRAARPPLGRCSPVTRRGRGEAALVAVVIYDGVEPIDIGGAVGVISMAGRVLPGLRAATVAERAGPVRCAGGLVAEAAHGFADAPAADAVLVTGGPGWKREAANRAMLGFLRRQDGARLGVSAPAPSSSARPGCFPAEQPPSAPRGGWRRGGEPALAPRRDGRPGAPGAGGGRWRRRAVDRGFMSLAIDGTLHLIGRLYGDAARDEVAALIGLRPGLGRQPGGARPMRGRAEKCAPPDPLRRREKQPRAGHVQAAPHEASAATDLAEAGKPCCAHGHPRRRRVRPPRENPDRDSAMGSMTEGAAVNRVAVGDLLVLARASACPRGARSRCAAAPAEAPAP